MNKKRRLNGVQLNSAAVAILFSICTAFFISYTYFQIFPNHLNPTILTEPVLFREGYLPFNNVADQKPPLLQYLIAWTLPLFSGNAVLAVRSLHSILVFIIVLVSLVWAYRVKSGWALFASGVFFLTWSLSFGYWATLYFDFVLTPFYLLTLFFLTNPEKRYNIWSSTLLGLITGLAILIKQHAAILCVLMAFSLVGLGIYHKVPFKKLSGLATGYLVGVLLPIALFVILFLYLGGDLNEFIYWTITINFKGKYASMAKLIPDKKALLALLPSLILLPLFLWSISSKSKEKIPSRSTRFWLLIVFLSTLLFIYPRWSGRHLAAALPFLAIISGITAADLVQFPAKKVRYLAGLILYIGCIVWWGALAVKTYSAIINQPETDRFDAYSNFMDLAHEIKKSIPPTGKVAIVPIDDGTMNLYYLLNRRPPSFMFFNYPWYMEEAVIQRWLDAMEKDQPVAVIYFSGRLGLEQSAPEMIEYISNHYQVDKEITWENKPVYMMTLMP